MSLFFGHVVSPYGLFLSKWLLCVSWWWLHVFWLMFCVSLSFLYVSLLLFLVSLWLFLDSFGCFTSLWLFSRLFVVVLHLVFVFPVSPSSCMTLWSFPFSWWCLLFPFHLCCSFVSFGGCFVSFGEISQVKLGWGLLGTWTRVTYKEILDCIQTHLSFPLNHSRMFVVFKCVLKWGAWLKSENVASAYHVKTSRALAVPHFLFLASFFFFFGELSSAASLLWNNTRISPLRSAISVTHSHYDPTLLLSVCTHVCIG